MKRLYNQYGAAVGEDAFAIQTFINRATDDIIGYVLKQNIDLRDAQNWSLGCLSVGFSEAILRKAVAMRQSERENNSERGPKQI